MKPKNTGFSSYYRKNRKRRVPLIRFFLFSILLTFAFRLIPDWFKSQPAKPPRQSATVVPLSVQEEPIIEALGDAIGLWTHVVKPGDTFLGILSRFDIRQDAAAGCYQSLKPLGLPPLYPGDSMVVKKGPDGSVKELSFLSRMQCWYEVLAEDSVVTAQRRSLQLSSYRYLINGVLETSLSEQIQQLGGSDVIAGKLADIFAWDINFFLDPRKGDAFQILFEQRFAEGRFVGYGEILAARYTCNGKDFYAIGFADPDGTLKYYDLNGKSVQKQFLKAPLRFSRISSRFSYNRKHPVLGIIRPHLGIDYAAPRGTPVYAAADGNVTFAGVKGGYGKYVVLTHGASYETSYGHLHSIAKGARRGIRLRQGDLVGTVGSTGLSTGPHLDYRMKTAGRYVNPQTISLPSCESVHEVRRSEFETIKQSGMAAFEMRFSGQNGCHIIDIEHIRPAENSVHRSMRTVTQVHLNGNPAGT